MQFIGRELELEKLRTFGLAPDPAIAVVYGRRRVGKSFLIREAFHGRPVLFFEALEKRPKREQLNHFIFQLNEQIPGAARETPASWKEAFLLLSTAIGRKPHIVVFDEFQWMANYRHELIADLKYVWDKTFAHVAGQKLVLCGSIASFMINKVIKSSALYGRIDIQLRLSGFTLHETAEMLSGRGLDEIMEAHMLTGGIPKYLQLMSGYPSIRLGMEAMAFTPDGYFVIEYERIFTSHFGKNPAFAGLVQTLARYPLGLFRDELARKTRLSAGGQLSAYLADLESAGFIRSVTPFDKGEGSRQIKYFLSDAYLRFYFTFIRPNIKKIAARRSGSMFASIVKTGAWHAWIGRSFEYLCVQHAELISERLGFSAVDYSVGPWFTPASKGTAGCQIDLLFDRADNVLTVCEMKYSSRPIGVEVIAEMEQKIRVLEPVAGRKTLQTVLIAREQPTSELSGRLYFHRILTAAGLFGVAAQTTRA